MYCTNFPFADSNLDGHTFSMPCANLIGSSQKSAKLTIQKWPNFTKSEGENGAEDIFSNLVSHFQPSSFILLHTLPLYVKRSHCSMGET